MKVRKWVRRRRENEEKDEGEGRFVRVLVARHYNAGYSYRF